MRKENLYVKRTSVCHFRCCATFGNDIHMVRLLCLQCFSLHSPSPNRFSFFAATLEDRLFCTHTCGMPIVSLDSRSVMNCDIQRSTLYYLRAIWFRFVHPIRDHVFRLEYTNSNKERDFNLFLFPSVVFNSLEHGLLNLLVSHRSMR